MMCWRACLGSLAAILLLLAGGLPVRALDSRKLPSHYLSQTWSIAEGLTDTYVQALAQTPDGYLWAGTQNSGLVRFDGVAFTPMRPGFGKSDEASVRALCAAADGTLWIGTDGAGLWKYSGGRFTLLTRAEGIRNENIRALLEDREGHLWVACAGAVLRLKNGAVVEEVEYSPARPAVHGMAEDQDGRIWLAGDGLWSWKAGHVTDHCKSDGVPEENFLAVCADLSWDSLKPLYRWKRNTALLGKLALLPS